MRGGEVKTKEKSESEMGLKLTLVLSQLKERSKRWQEKLCFL